MLFTAFRILTFHFFFNFLVIAVTYVFTSNILYPNLLAATMSEGTNGAGYETCTHNKASLAVKCDSIPLKPALSLEHQIGAAPT